MKFYKYHALGNDYIVIDPQDLGRQLSHADIINICDRHRGVGADGILYGPERSDVCDFALRIFNPDSSEAEKSGNGLRIFSRYLWDQSLVSDERFTIQTKGGAVYATVGERGLSVSVGMGKVSFSHERAIEAGIAKPVEVKIKGNKFTCYLANVGNPHCVIFSEEVNDSYAKEYGGLIATHSRFQRGTNVQFVKVMDRDSIEIEIWERGAGYTLASGSSSTAAACVAHSLGYCDSIVDVHMPGGVIEIKIDEQYRATMTGDVRKICEGVISNEALQKTL